MLKPYIHHTSFFLHNLFHHLDSYTIRMSRDSISAPYTITSSRHIYLKAILTRLKSSISDQALTFYTLNNNVNRDSDLKSIIIFTKIWQGSVSCRCTLASNWVIGVDSVGAWCPVVSGAIRSTSFGQTTNTGLDSLDWPLHSPKYRSTSLNTT